jgi:hypothetical protein
MYLGKMQTSIKSDKLQEGNMHENDKVLEESKKKSIRENKIKVNVYLSEPNNVYYEMMLSPGDVIGNLLIYIEKFFPKDKYDHVCIYKNDCPIFTNYDTGEEIDISKTYIQHGFYIKESQRNNGYGSRSGSGSDIHEPSCSIKIKLKITKLKEIKK